MYKTLLVFSSEKLRDDIAAMNIWGESSYFEVAKITDSTDTACAYLKEHTIDLVIIEVDTDKIDALKLLNTSKKEGLCDHIVFCSENANFEYARQGIINGAFDYFVKPFNLNQFNLMFTRIKSEKNESSEFQNDSSDKIISCFEKYDSNICGCINDEFSKICVNYSSEHHKINAVNKLFKDVVSGIFNKYEWLELYVSEKSFYNFPYEKPELTSLREFSEKKLMELYNDYSEIFPRVNNEKISEIILYIIENPDSDLKQKTIANKLYLSSSYLSTVFSAHMGMKFVDYLTTVRMKRASWLLCNTDMKITEIAERLDYKDIGYFSRVFKKIYNLSPSEYRTFENCSFDI